MILMKYYLFWNLCCKNYPPCPPVRSSVWTNHRWIHLDCLYIIRMEVILCHINVCMFFFKTFINSTTYNYINCLPFIVCVSVIYIISFWLKLLACCWHTVLSLSSRGKACKCYFSFLYSNWMGLDPHYWAVHCLSGMFITHLPLYVRAVSVPVF